MWESFLLALVVVLTVTVVVLLLLLQRALQSQSAAPPPAKGQACEAPSSGEVRDQVAHEGVRRRNVGSDAEVKVPQVGPAAEAEPPARVRSPSRLVPPTPESPSRQSESEAEDARGRFQAVLERDGDVAWGFAWNVSALAMKRLILAGVDPTSPAGQWNASQKADGQQQMQRGDEVVAVNDITTYSEMRKELASQALELKLSLVVEAASPDSSPNRDALRRRREASSKASSASGLSDSPLNTTSAKSTQESSKARSPGLPMGSDQVKVKNTFIEVSEEILPEEECAARFTRSDPTPMLIALRAAPTLGIDVEEDLTHEEPEATRPTPDPGTPRDFSPQRTPDTPEAPGLGQPLLLQQLLEPPEMPGPLLYTPECVAQEATPELGHPHPQMRWTSQTLPLPPGALPPGPVRAPSPISEVSPSDHSGQVQDQESESETEVTSPESRRKPTRRGGRRARHRKLAALARQQAAVQGEQPAGLDAPLGVSPSRTPEAGERIYTPQAVPSMSSTSSPCYAGVPGYEVEGAQLIGSTVLIQGLVRSPEFNGQWGYVESYDPQMQRYLVSVVLPSGGVPLQAKLRRENLVLPSNVSGGLLPTLPPFPELGKEQVSNPLKASWPAEPAFVHEPFMPMFPGMAVQASSPGPAADFEDSVGGALMTPAGARIEPGHSLEDSGSPQDHLSQASGFRQLWLNQSAADFEDSVAGQLVLESPKSSRRFGFGYAEGTAADFEDSIGGTMTGLPDFLRHDDDASAKWQPSLRPKS